MTIRKTPLAIALLAVLLVGGVAVLAGVTPMWRGRVDDQRIAERDRLLADLGRSQRDTAVMQNHAAQVTAAAAREAERVAGNRLATLQHELRQWQKQADEAESRLADAQRQWRREHARQRDDRRSSGTKAGALQKKVDRLTGELAKAQSDLAEANRRIAALESRPSGQRKVRMGRPVSDSSDN